jgi:hypothetical protein
MATKQNSKNGKGGITAAEVGAGIAAVGAAAAAGYYFYASKDAKKHRREAAKWAGGFKDEVIREAKRMGDLDARSVARAVDSAVLTYEGLRGIDRSELARAARELKANWERVQSDVMKAGKRGATRAKRSVKKAAKKAGKKAAKAVKKARSAKKRA